MTFRQVEHTADLAIEAEAATLEELFVEALRGTTDAITAVERVALTHERSFEAAAGALDLLLVEWLDEALYAFEIHREIYAAAAVEIVETQAGWRLRATARGELWDSERHRPRVAIKGVTYHRLALERRGDTWWCRFILDI